MGHENIAQAFRFRSWPGEKPEDVPRALWDRWDTGLTAFRRFIEVRHDMTRAAEDGCLEDWFSLLAGGERFGVVIRSHHGDSYVFEADCCDKNGWLLKLDDCESFADAVHALLVDGGRPLSLFAGALERVPEWRRIPEAAFLQSV